MIAPRPTPARAGHPTISGCHVEIGRQFMNRQTMTIIKLWRALSWGDQRASSLARDRHCGWRKRQGQSASHLVGERRWSMHRLGVLDGASPTLVLGIVTTR